MNNPRYSSLTDKTITITRWSQMRICEHRSWNHFYFYFTLVQFYQEQNNLWAYNMPWFSENVIFLLPQAKEKAQSQTQGVDLKWPDHWPTSVNHLTNTAAVYHSVSHHGWQGEDKNRGKPAEGTIEKGLVK
jgi:hypothetical protein